MDTDSGNQTTPGPSQSKGSTPSTVASTSQARNSKRSRAPGAVTSTACTECRKKRAKCDGQTPCGRCRAQNSAECIYETPERKSKDDLRNEIESLQLRQRSSHRVFSALARPDLREDVLRRLHDDQSVETISKWISKSQLLEGSASPTDDGRGVSTTSSAFKAVVIDSGASGADENIHDAVDGQPAFANGPERDSLEPSGHILAPLSIPQEQPATETWTTITNDISFVQHLLELYFCWEYPTFASLSKEHFMSDFQAGRPRYCSPILVNALLALGCRFSSHPLARVTLEDSKSAGEHFFGETRRLLYEENDLHSLTTIQGLGIMSIREASCGRDLNSRYYAEQCIRLAFEMGLNRPSPDADHDDILVRSATFWGAYTLDHEWSLATGSLPQCSRLPPCPPKPDINEEVEAALWIPYSESGLTLHLACEQPSNVRLLYKCFCELSELVHQSLYLLYSPDEPLLAKNLLRMYTKYLSWYDGVPEVMRLGQNFTPAVLFTHMYYHFAIMLLFRPLIKLRIIGSQVSPRDVCLQAADALGGFVASYSKLYKLTKTPSFVPHVTLTSCIMYLAIAAVKVQIGQSGVRPETNPVVMKALKTCIVHLKEMAKTHQFAEQAISVIHYLAEKWDIDLDFGTGAAMDPDELERLVKIYAGGLDAFRPHLVGENYVIDWKTPKQATGSAEDTRFYPFVMQGGPIFSTVKDLEDAGFAVI